MNDEEKSFGFWPFLLLPGCVTDPARDYVETASSGDISARLSGRRMHKEEVRKTFGLPDEVKMFPTGEEMWIYTCINKRLQIRIAPDGFVAQYTLSQPVPPGGQPDIIVEHRRTP